MLAAVFVAAALATPVTLPATEVGATGATLNGTVEGATTAHFVYGTTTGYGLATQPRAIATDGPVSAPVSGLTVDTIYHYKIVTDAGEGQNMTFRTAGPPAVSSQVASNVTTSQATVSATIDTKGLRTSYRVEWGRTTGYGRFTPVETADSGTATATVTLTDLLPNRTYHWRTRASNDAGTTVGRDRAFKTPPLPTGVTLALSRGTVPWGDGLRLGGRVTGAGVSGLTVALEQRRVGLDADFTPVGTTRTGRDGGYLFTIPQLWTNTGYRVRTQTQTVATSPVVTARSRVRVGARSREVSRRRARIQGSVLPAVDGTATLQLRRPGRGWRRVRTVPLRPGATSSRYGFRVQRLKHKSRRFRVMATPTAETNVRGWSRSVRVEPRRR